MSVTLLLADSGLAVDKVDIVAASQSFEDGQVTWRLRTDSENITLPTGNTSVG